jgi:hypothetical protein
MPWLVLTFVRDLVCLPSGLYFDLAVLLRGYRRDGFDWCGAQIQQQVWHVITHVFRLYLPPRALRMGSVLVGRGLVSCMCAAARSSGMRQQPAYLPRAVLLRFLR